ncbi:MAG: CBS domain-containing protein [bacterium]
MKVADVMTRNPRVIDPEAPIRQALRLLREGGFRRLPVVQDKELVGIISERDLRQAMNTPVLLHERKQDDYILDNVKVGTCMSSQVYTLSPEDSLSKAAALMKEKKVGGCPVIHRGELVGIITESDLLDYLVRSIEAGRLL